MKQMQYVGFTRKSCFCNYLVAELDGQTVVIFEDLGLVQTSITNTVEDLASQVLANDLKGVDPTRVRFFLHYPARFNPLAEWQEVAFKSHDPVYEKKSLLGKVAEQFGMAPSIEWWRVDEPTFDRVSTETQKRLSALS